MFRSTLGSSFAAAIAVAVLSLSSVQPAIAQSDDAATLAEVRALREQVAELAKAVEQTRAMLAETRQQVDAARGQSTDANGGATADEFSDERAALAAERRALALERARLEGAREQLRSTVHVQSNRYESLPRPTAAGTYAASRPASEAYGTYTDTRNVTTTYSTSNYAAPQPAYGVTTTTAYYPSYSYRYYNSAYCSPYHYGFYPRYYVYPSRYYTSFGLNYHRHSRHSHGGVFFGVKSGGFRLGVGHRF